MRSSLRLLLLPLVLACAPAALAGEPETIDNPEYQQWSKFKAGAWAKVKTTSGDGAGASVMTMTTKLVSLTAEKAVLEMVVAISAGGQEFAQPAQTRDVPAKMEKPVLPKTEEPAEQPKPTVKEGTEDVTVAGKKVSCKTMETTIETAEMKTWSKSWTSDAVPGWIVKQETKIEKPVAGTSTTVLEDFRTE